MPPSPRNSMEHLYEDVKFLAQTTLPEIQARLSKIEAKVASQSVLWTFNALLLGAILVKLFVKL